MRKARIKFAFVMSLTVTCYISFTLVAVNLGFRDKFVMVWLRSWLIAFIIAFLSLLFVAPIVRKLLKI